MKTKSSRKDTLRGVLGYVGRYRGYLRLTLTPQELLAESMGVENIRLPDSAVKVRARWAVEPGRIGAQKA